jgi:hypothetical protein
MKQSLMCAMAGFVLLMCSPARAQQIGSIENRPQGALVKAENDLIIAWHRGISRNSDSSRINVFDEQGNRLVAFDILRLVPEAESVSIYDVSAWPQQMIAVGAVYSKGPAVTPADVLLFFDFKGALFSATALDPSREIARLELDDKLDAWTLTLGPGDKNPKDAPLVVEYDGTGKVVRELLPRDLFPMHSEHLAENPQVGAVSAGYESGAFWFWLPGSTDLVTIRTEDGEVTTRTTTGLPRVLDGTVWPLGVFREASGAVIADVRIQRQAPTKEALLAHYAWSPQAKSWSPFDPGSCAGGDRLIGVNGNDQIYLRFDNSSALCTYSRQ